MNALRLHVTSAYVSCYYAVRHYNALIWRRRAKRAHVLLQRQEMWLAMHGAALPSLLA